jgi:probable HAF family extracellular repeat protein
LGQSRSQIGNAPRDAGEKNMKRNLNGKIAAITLFAALALTLRLAAQDSQDHNHHKQGRYSVKILGTLGGTTTDVVGINNRGEAAGSSTLPGDQVRHATLWRNGAVIDLGTLGGPDSVAPEASPQPNDRGEIAGASYTSTPDPNAAQFCSLFMFISDPYTCRPFVWRRGVMVALSTLGGNNAVAWQVNNEGQVSGISQNTTPDPTCSVSELEGKPVIWDRGKIQQLPIISGDLDGFALSINDRGQAVGSTGNCLLDIPLTSLHAVLWQRDDHRWTATDLGNLGGTEWNLAFGVNKLGQVVGQSGLPGNMAFHAFLWSENTMTDLGTLPGDFVSWAETINNNGQAVGASFDASGNARAVIWENGAIADLNTLIPPGSPWLLWEALGNNDRGQIVGPAFNTMSGEFEGYLLTPCDENHGGDEDCEEGVGENAVVPTSPISHEAPSGKMPQSLVRRMNQYRFTGLALGPRN